MLRDKCIFFYLSNILSKIISRETRNMGECSGIPLEKFRKANLGIKYQYSGDTKIRCFGSDMKVAYLISIRRPWYQISHQ